MRNLFAPLWSMHWKHRVALLSFLIFGVLPDIAGFCLNALWVLPSGRFLGLSHLFQ